MSLHNLKPVPGSRKPKVIVGRGEGSTLGQTCGKGQKGQTSRSGDGVMTGFEGGQTPLLRRIPKRGFNHPQKVIYEPINLGVLDAMFDAGSEINGKTLHAKGLLKGVSQPFKILGSGKVTKSFKVSGSKLSKTAERLIKEAGGTVSV